MADITHKVGIKAPASRVYAALSTVAGVAGWWTRETSGDEKLGCTMSVCFRHQNGEQVGQMGFELTELSPDQQVVWRFTSGPEEWLGTRATFELSQRGEQTVVLFGHRGWPEAKEFMAHCSMKWATFLLSLKQLLETGRGMPAPDDLKIDDWN
jgi:uncharacterized protein YndB with AHSA1/START domain